jgi:hypothetical protein
LNSNDYYKEYYKKNREKILSRVKEYNISNKLKINNYKLEHRDEHMQYMKDYHKKNKLKIKEYRHKKNKIDYLKNKTILIKKSRDYRKIPENKQKIRNAYFIREYGINLNDYNNLLKLQNNKCCLCFSDFDFDNKNKFYPRVDHNHKTGIIRGILCNSCNLALGYIYDNLNVAKNIVSYLEKYNL